MKARHLGDYSIVRAGSEVIAVGIPLRAGRTPVRNVRASGFGDLQWTAADGLVESIGSIEFPVPSDVLARFSNLPGLLLIEIDAEPVSEQNLTLQMTR